MNVFLRIRKSIVIKGNFRKEVFRIHNLIFLPPSFIISQLNVQERKWLKIRKGAMAANAVKPGWKNKKKKPSFLRNGQDFSFLWNRRGSAEGPFSYGRDLIFMAGRFLRKGILEFIPPGSYNYIKKCGQRTARKEDKWHITTNFTTNHVDHPWREERGWICQRKLKKLDKVIQLMYNILKGMALPCKSQMHDRCFSRRTEGLGQSICLK